MHHKYHSEYLYVCILVKFRLENSGERWKKDAGVAATSAEQAKRRKYENLDSSLIFVPFGVETLGPWGPEAEPFSKNYRKGLSSLPVILERAVTLANELVWPSKGAMLPAS
ncbi:jg6633 [Pararge aegeria aegeria]|uniref:Jg6633 protein n=1 Tax=Pararge aegeria aegeria TaxID=348720 RepID=A0A8S4RR07_9NEOP|nr:jg6633 [Pararge aegeria aegeria]